MKKKQKGSRCFSRGLACYGLVLFLATGCNRESDQSLLSDSQLQLKAKDECRGLWAGEIGYSDGQRENPPDVQLVPSGPGLGAEILESTALVGANATNRDLQLQNVLTDLEKTYESQLKSFLAAQGSAELELFGMLCKPGGVEISADGVRGFRVVYDAMKPQPSVPAQKEQTLASANTEPDDCQKNSKSTSAVVVPHKPGQRGTAHVVVADHGALAAKVIKKLEAEVEYFEVDLKNESSNGSGSDKECEPKPAYHLVRSAKVPVGIVLNVPKRAIVGFNNPAQNRTGGTSAATSAKTNWDVFNADLSAATGRSKVFRCLDLASEYKNDFPRLILFESVKSACAKLSALPTRSKNRIEQP